VNAHGSGDRMPADRTSCIPTCEANAMGLQRRSAAPPNDIRFIVIQAIVQVPREKKHSHRLRHPSGEPLLLKLCTHLSSNSLRNTTEDEHTERGEAKMMKVVRKKKSTLTTAETMKAALTVGCANSSHVSNQGSEAEMKKVVWRKDMYTHR